MGVRSALSLSVCVCGKSAILTALCVAFGCRARGTQRANTLKDFIKSGCSYALVQVEIKNQGEDAFKHELYGDIIIVERRITESAGGNIALKNSQGRKIGSKREDLREIVEYFNIDVENPCTIMSQDKSREFLHSGNGKDKFKFFFKATLLQQVDDLLQGISKQLHDANGLVSHLEDSLRPAKKELDELQDKIKNMEAMEKISQQVQSLREKLAWSWVYDADRKLDAQHKLIEKLKGRIPSCQAKIDQKHHMMEELNDRLATKKNEISSMMERTSEVRRMKEDLQESLSMAAKEQFELTGERDRINRQIAKMSQQVRSLERQIQESHEQYVKNTQAEENEMEERVRELQNEADEANANILRLKEEEDNMMQRITTVENEIQQISHQIEDVEQSNREFSSRIREIQMHQRNKVTAFGGGRVTHLLQVIERNQHKFSMPPIGPIGAHVQLEHGDMWAIAIENAVGRLLNTFIVTNHNDSRILRACAREANYNHLPIIVHDFRRPRINIPRLMLPQTNHPTALSVLHTDNSTVLNVLIDSGNAERQVLVKDYEVGKAVTFDQRIPNLKEVYTSDGYKMFYRSSAQTILPPNKNIRAGRLSGSFDDQIKYLEREASESNLKAQQGRGQKRAKEEELMDLRNILNNVKRRRITLDRQFMSKKFELNDAKNLLSSEANAAHDSNLDELHQDISKLQDEIREKEALLAKIQDRVNEAGTKAKNLKMSLENLCDSAKSEMDALEKAENELMTIEGDLKEAERERKHYEGIMHTKVLADLKNAEAEYRELEHSCQESRRKASIIIPESEIDVGFVKESNPEKLSAELTRSTEKLKREGQRYPESIDDLRMLHEKKKRKISRKLDTYKAFQEKLEACEKALNLRRSKFQRNATLLKRQLTWQFNGHLKKKGISGQIKVSYEEQTLSVEVKMPQDASSSSVRDTSGLSGGERSFSTLCFALALHEMTEAPFRAMDEFDVFMDAVSRKISLDALVDFALAQGSQWIFITPHDISMVKNDERIKKQQMAAPRG
ncbi:structural maintenance of chromosomes protein 6B-like isoform X2 [Salvia miltiorrhiza]|uniref:structural maintenance of chromosomes protein 6B-like isoform X2 n=1 Tax=Salvia miltiorrhiza TaxID=226208 RepID=UPI0025ABB242|nr:structural maintenance of chromosomes protein 6B-like isoform X2 [Salvia miltiorrhiza]